MTDVPPQTSTEKVVTTPTKDPVVRLLIVAAMCLGFSIYCIYDAYVVNKYPYKSYSEDVNAFFSHIFNHYLPFLLIPAGLVAAFLAIRFLSRRLMADAEGIGYVGGRKIRWEEITTVDASDLAGKEVLRLYYDDDKKLTVDGWKLRPFKEILAVIESHVPATRIKTTKD